MSDVELEELDSIFVPRCLQRGATQSQFYEAATRIQEGLNDSTYSVADVLDCIEKANGDALFDRVIGFTKRVFMMQKGEKFEKEYWDWWAVYSARKRRKRMEEHRR